MTERSFDEMIAYFNRRVASMDINQDYKMELLGMVTALGFKHEKSEPRWIPCSERLPEIGEKGTSDMVLLCWSDGQRTVGAYQGNRTFVGQAWPEARSCRVTVTAWMPLPNPWKGETE